MKSVKKKRRRKRKGEVERKRLLRRGARDVVGLGLFRSRGRYLFGFLFSFFLLFSSSSSPPPPMARMPTPVELE